MSTIRLAQASDLPMIVTIFNQAVEQRFQTAATELTTIEQRTPWLEEHQASRYPVYVLEEEEMVKGWMCFSPHRKGRKALQFVAEVSYYIHQEHQQQGIGTRLVEFALQQAKALSFRHLFAIILDRNIASIRLLEKLGFRQWGYLPDIADFDGEICGQVYYGRAL